MAKNRAQKNPTVEPEEPAVADEAAEFQQEETPRHREMAARPRRSSGGLFQMYKPHQGRKIRLYTAIGAGILIAAATHWLFRKLDVSMDLYPAVGIALGIAALLSLLTWYLVGVRPGTVDFLVATESEMKKVTWSSRSEVIGATKVVIGMVVLLSAGLFIVDILFTIIFRWLGVLQTPF